MTLNSKNEYFEEKDRPRLLLALDESASRANIGDPSRAFNALLDSAVAWGNSIPERQKISALLAKICTKRVSLFPRLLRATFADEASPALIFCFADSLPLMPRTLQSKAVSPLVKAVQESHWAADSAAMEHFIRALVTIGNGPPRRELTKELLPLLSNLSDFPVLSIAVRVLSKVGDAPVASEMARLLQQSLDGYFQDASLEPFLCDYFERNPVEAAVPLIVRAFREKRKFELLRIIPRFRYDSMTKAIVSLVQDSAKTPQVSYDLLILGLRGLAQLDVSAGEVRMLLGDPVLRRDFRSLLLDIAVRTPELKPDMLKGYSSEDETLRGFASEWLRRMQVSIDEITAHTGKGPISRAYEFFFPDDTIDKIWADKASLGSNIKGQSINRFDFLVHQSLACLNFHTVYVDKSRRDGVDVIGFSPTANLIVVAGVTTGVVKDDLQKLDRTVRELEVATGYELRSGTTGLGQPDILGLDKPTVNEIVREVSSKIRKANDEVFKPYGIRLSNKNLSEIIGKILEKTSSDILSRKLGYLVKNAQNDSEPDVFFTQIEKSLEIKVTSTVNAWTGGEFSQRPFEYLLVSWGGDFDEFFAAFTHLEKQDWHSHISQKFYGPSYTAHDLFEKKEKVVFLGDFEVSKQGSVKLKRENILSQGRLS